MGNVGKIILVKNLFSRYKSKGKFICIHDKEILNKCINRNFINLSHK